MSTDEKNFILQWCVTLAVVAVLSVWGFVAIYLERRRRKNGHDATPPSAVR